MGAPEPAESIPSPRPTPLLAVRPMLSPADDTPRLRYGPPPAPPPPNTTPLSPPVLVRRAATGAWLASLASARLLFREWW